MLNLFSSAVTSLSRLSRPSLHAFRRSKNSFASWAWHEHDARIFSTFSPWTSSCPQEGTTAPWSPRPWRRSGSSWPSPPSTPSRESPGPPGPETCSLRQAALGRPISPWIIFTGYLIDVWWQLCHTWPLPFIHESKPVRTESNWTIALLNSNRSAKNASILVNTWRFKKIVFVFVCHFLNQFLYPQK